MVDCPSLAALLRAILADRASGNTHTHTHGGNGAGMWLEECDFGRGAVRGLLFCRVGLMSQFNGDRGDDEREGRREKLRKTAAHFNGFG